MGSDLPLLLFSPPANFRVLFGARIVGLSVQSCLALRWDARKRTYTYIHTHIHAYIHIHRFQASITVRPLQTKTVIKCSRA